MGRTAGRELVSPDVRDVGPPDGRPGPGACVTEGQALIISLERLRGFERGAFSGPGGRAGPGARLAGAGNGRREGKGLSGGEGELASRPGGFPTPTGSGCRGAGNRSRRRYSGA